MKKMSLVLLCCFSIVCASQSASSMTEDELMGFYLSIVESSVDVFEPLWVDDSSRIPNAGFYDFRKYPNWRDEPYATIIVIPGNGMIQFCNSILLTETDKKTFGKQNIPRETLLQRTIQSLRWCCLTSTYVDAPYAYLPNTRDDFRDGDKWRRRFSWRADEVGWLTMAAAKLWPQLDDETKSLIEYVMIGGAPQERLVQHWEVPQGGNHDEVKQDLSSTMGAAYLLPHRSDGQLYWDIIAGNGIDMVSTMHDFANPVMAEGRPISEWAQGWNLYQDYAGDHHGWLNIWYASDLVFEGRSYIEILGQLTGKGIPETFNYAGNGYDGVMQWVKTLFLPIGEPFSPHGNEYDAYYGAGLLAYCYGAVIKQDPVAARLEEQAALLLKRQSQAVRQYDYHRNSWAKAGMAYLMHKLRGPRCAPVALDEALASLEGSYHYRSQQNLIHRTSDHLSSFAWGSISSHRPHSSYYGTGLCGLVYPFGTDEPLIYAHPMSLMGSYTFTDRDGKPIKPVRPETLFTYNYSDTGFNTSGVANAPQGDRYYSFFSFDDGPTIFFSQFKAKQDMRMTWSGLPVYFYVRDGLTGDRNYSDELGSTILGEPEERRSSWWSVNDSMAMVVYGEQQNIVLDRSPGYNWARKPEYRDLCDGVFVSPIKDQEILNNETAHDLALAIYTDTSQQRIDEISKRTRSYNLELPDGWKGIVAEHANHPSIRFIALSNMQASNTDAMLELSFKEGAPVVAQNAIVMGNKSIISIHQNALESFSDKIQLYLSVADDSTIHALKLSGNEYQLSPLQNQPSTVDFYFVEPDLKSITLLDQNKNIIKKVENKQRFTYKIDKPIFFQCQTTEDHIAPSVEIRSAKVREDKLIEIDVNAADQSGIQQIELYCDQQSLGAKSQPPFVWLHRPPIGAHTFYAIASDDSPRHNMRTSFKRTIIID